MNTSDYPKRQVNPNQEEAIKKYPLSRFMAIAGVAMAIVVGGVALEVNGAPHTRNIVALPHSHIEKAEK